MFGEGMVSFGVCELDATDCRYVKSSAKIVFSSPILLSMCSAAGVNSMVPEALRNRTAMLPGALLTPPIW